MRALDTRMRLFLPTRILLAAPPSIALRYQPDGVAKASDVNCTHVQYAATIDLEMIC